jgi:hypothetical protein
MVDLLKPLQKNTPTPNSGDTAGMPSLGTLNVSGILFNFHYYGISKAI